MLYAFSLSAYGGWPPSFGLACGGGSGPVPGPLAHPVDLLAHGDGERDGALGGGDHGLGELGAARTRSRNMSLDNPNLDRRSLPGVCWPYKFRLRFRR